jgi:hypothetical protein
VRKSEIYELISLRALMFDDGDKSGIRLHRVFVASMEISRVVFSNPINLKSFITLSSPPPIKVITINFNLMFETKKNKFFSSQAP